MSHRTKIALTLTALLPVLLNLGCASPGPESGAGTTPDIEECVRIRSVRAYDAIDDQHVWVTENANRQFLLTLYSRCPDISLAQALAFTNMNTICPGNPGSVTFSGPRGGLRCDIRTVDRVGSRGEAEAIIEDRRRHGN